MKFQCVGCKGKSFKNVKKRLERQVDSRTFFVNVPAWQCKACDEVYHDGVWGSKFELAVAGQLANFGTVSADAFRYMRRALGMQSGELATLLGVARETISRWEADKCKIDRAVILTLGSLVLDKIQGRDTTLKRLRLSSKKRSVKRKTQSMVKLY